MSLNFNMHMDDLEPKISYKAFPKQLNSLLSYFVMRVQFISPVFVPGLKEPSLRPDFNFAEYLARSYGHTLNRFWQLNFLVITVLFASILFGTHFANQWTSMTEDD